MHHSDTQPRMPLGHPDGGEWAVVEGEPSNFDLRTLNDDDYNADGSFEFPPAPRTANQVLKFWAQVPVSDTLLEAIVVTFSATRQQEAEAIRERVLQEYRTASRSERKAMEVAAGGGGDVIADAAVNAHFAQYPNMMRVDDVRTIARAAQAYHQAESLPQQERDRVRDAEVFLNARGGVTLTIAACEERYGLNDSGRNFRANGLFRDQTRWVGENVLEVRRALTDLTNYLTPSEAELHQQMADQINAEARASRRRR